MAQDRFRFLFISIFFIVLLFFEKSLTVLSEQTPSTAEHIEKQPHQAYQDVGSTHEETIQKQVVPSEPAPDQMPSFEEWKRQVSVPQSTISTVIPNDRPTFANGNGDSSHVVIQTVLDTKDSRPTGNDDRDMMLSSGVNGRNYASHECGAKVLSSTEGSNGASRILTEMMDEYMLNPCKNNIWVVVELCEPIQLTHLQLANLELYSSMPKEFIVYSSESYPTREWTLVGQFTAPNQRVIHAFSIDNSADFGFRKYLKIEFLSRYGEEHYCPLSILRAYGTTMVDEFDKIENGIAGDTSTPATPTVESSSQIPILDGTTNYNSPLNTTSQTSSSTTANRTALDFARDIVIRTMRRFTQFISKSTPASPDEDSNEIIFDESKYSKELGVYTIKSWDLINRLEKSLHSYLSYCGTCGTEHLAVAFSNQSYDRVETNFCRFLNALLGDELFSLLCFEHMRSVNSSLFFQCDAQLVPSGDKLTLVDKSISADNKKQRPDKSTMSNLTDEQKPLDLVSLPPVAINSSELTSAEAGVQSETRQVEEAIMRLKEIVQNESLFNPAPIQVNITSEPVVSYETVSTDETIISDPTKPVDLPSTPENIAAGPQVTDDKQDSKPDNSVASISETSSKPEIGPIAASIGLKPVIGPQHFTSVPIPGPSNPRESVFIRLSNRIKSLELNMSLSSQYLEELSQRYRRQVDEMQRSFNKTVARLNETERLNAERDLKQVDAITVLEDKISQLMSRFNQLQHDQATFNVWIFIIHGALIVIQVGLVIMTAIYATRIANTHRLFLRNQVPVNHTVQPIVLNGPITSNDEMTVASDSHTIQPDMLENLLPSETPKRNAVSDAACAARPLLRPLNANPCARFVLKKSSSSPALVELLLNYERRPHRISTNNKPFSEERKESVEAHAHAANASRTSSTSSGISSLNAAQDRSGSHPSTSSRHNQEPHQHGTTVSLSHFRKKVVDENMEPRDCSPLASRAFSSESGKSRKKSTSGSYVSSTASTASTSGPFPSSSSVISSSFRKLFKKDKKPT